MNINFDDKIPIYIQIMDLIKKEIATENLKGGDKLLSVRELSSKLKVNPNTIQRAYRELEREGLTYTQRGMGSFVVENKETIKKLKMNMAKNVINNFIIGMKELGFNKNDMLDALNKELNKEGL